MTKADLIDKIAAAASLTKADAGRPRILPSTPSDFLLRREEGYSRGLRDILQFPSGKPERTQPEDRPGDPRIAATKVPKFHRW